MENAVYTFSLAADAFSNLPLFPVFQCAHYILMILAIREEPDSLLFTCKHPAASWLSSIVSCFAGGIVSSILLGLPVVTVFQNAQALAAASLIWYLIFFAPSDIFNRLCNIKYVKAVLIILKECQRSRNVLSGVTLALSLYPDSWITAVIIGSVKGAGSKVLKPVDRLLRGKITTDHALIKPAFVTKICVLISFLYVLQYHSVIIVPVSHLVLSITIFSITCRLGAFLFGAPDPFDFLDALSGAVLFRTVTDEQNGSVGDVGRSAKPEKQREDRKLRKKD